MPIEDGISFLKSIRAAEDRIPFILFTGKGREDIIIEALNNGADFYLQKGGSPKPQYAELQHKIKMVVEKRAKEDALVESETFFRLVIETLPIGLWLADKDGKLIMSNPAGREIWAADPRVGQDEYGIFKAWRLPDMNPVRPDDWALGHAINDGAATEFEKLEIEAFNGERKTIFNWASPVKKANGEIIGAFVINQDITSEIETSRALEASEQKYRSYIDHSPFGVFISDERGRYLEVNETAAIITGYNSDELRSMSIADIVTETCLPESVASLKRAVIEGSARTVSTYKHKNGETRFWSVDAVRISPTRLVSFVQDVTSNKRIEQDLRIKDMAIDSAISGIVLTDPDGLFTYTNKRFLEMIGMPDGSSIIGHRPLEYISSPENFSESFAAILNGENWKGDVSIRRMDGSQMMVTMSANRVLNEDGNVITVIATMNDITKRKMMELTLAQSEETHRTILASSGMSVMLWSLEGKLLYINNLGASYMNSVPERLVGQFITDLFGDEPGTTFLKRIAETASSPIMLEFEENVSIPTGKRWFVSIFTKVLDSTGRIVGVQSVSYDITERKMLENAVNMANHKLNLLTNITRHDLNNLLTVMKGHLELALCADEVGSKDHLQKAMEAGDHIDSIIGFTKNYENIGISAPRWQRLIGAIWAAHREVGAFDLPMEMNVAHSLEVLADDMVYKVFYNLMDNSIKHGGSITRLRCWTKIDGDRLNIFLSDDGIGIPEKEKERIFQRGFGKNTGLGLFLAKDILELTGASIDEIGEHGHGAIFKMGFPAGSYRFHVRT